MADMVLLKCDIGSKAAIVLCPVCGRISRQILSVSYSPNRVTELLRPHTCPVCNIVYRGLNASQAIHWSAAFAQYSRNADAYNQSVKEDYARKAQTDVVAETRRAIPAYPTGVSVSIENESARETAEIKNGVLTQINALQQQVDRNVTENTDGDTGTNESMSPHQKVVQNTIEDRPAESAISCVTDPNNTESVFSTVSSEVPVAYDEDLNRKIERWKRELLDTGKRNKMINFRETKRATLRILEPEASALFNRLAFSEKQLTFQKPINKDTDLRTYSMIALMETLSQKLDVQVGDIKTAGTIIERERTLKNLRSKAKLAQEEQGTNILYLCFGFIYWREHNRESSPWLKAPLLLMPVTLGLKSLSAPYTLSRFDDEIEVNPTLNYLFHTEYHIDLPSFELKNQDSFNDYVAKIEQIVDKRGWKVTHEVSLGLLSFLKISMYHDLNNNRELMMNHPVIRAMAGDRLAIGELPPEAEHFDFDSIKPDEWHEVVDSDSSQEEAILLSKLGVSFVMQGPPGTGKSQTITNIIAEAMADGKKVLFVSEKAAALQVVLKRLTEVHLDDFCLSLHNYKANKKEIIDSIGSNLSIQDEYIDDAAFSELTELFHDREFLNNYAGELHKPIAPFDHSVYTVFGKISKLDKASVIAFSIDQLEDISREQYASILYCVSAFEKALHNMDGALSANPWFGTKATSSGQTYKQQLLYDTNGLSDELRRIAGLADSINERLEAGVGKRISDVKKLIEIAMILKARPNHMNRMWFDSDAAAHARIQLQDAQRHSEILHQYSRAVVNDWRETILNLESESIRANFCGDYSWIYNRNENIPIEQRLVSEKEVAESLLHRIEEILTAYHEALDILSLKQEDSVENIQIVSKVLALISDAPYMEVSWFDKRKNAEIVPLVKEAVVHSSSIDSITEEVLTNWEPAVFDIDAEGMLSRFKTEYTEEFLKTCTEYQSEIESLRECAKLAKTVTDVDTILELNQKITELKKEREAFEAKYDSLRAELGDGYIGEQTEWDLVSDHCNSVLKEADALIDTAILISRDIQNDKKEVLDEWETSIFDVDVDGMLERFKLEYVGLFGRLKSTYKADIRTLRICSKKLGIKLDNDTISDVLNKVRNICDKTMWFETNHSALTEILGEGQYSDTTDWDQIRQEKHDTTNAVLKVITEAKDRAELIGLKENEVLEIWEPAIFDFDLENLAVRCKGKYTEKFFATKAQYRDDIRTLESYTRNAVDAINVVSAISLLQKVSEVKAERKWFEDKQDAFNAALGNQYRGETTEWRRLRESMSAALQITDQFPYGSIPENTVAALLRITESMQLSGTARRLADVIAAEKIDAAESQMQNCCFIRRYTEKCNLSEVIIPQIEGFIENCEMQSYYIADFKAARKSEILTYEDITTLLYNIDVLKEERKWFNEHQPELQLLFGDAYCGENSNWIEIANGIETAEHLLAICSNVVPERIMTRACNQDETDTALYLDVADLTGLLEKAEPKLRVFSAQFNENEFQTQDLFSVADRYDACMNGFGELNKWLDFVETREECNRKGLTDFTDKIVALDNSIIDVQDAFERGFYIQWLNCHLDGVPAVQSFRRRIHEQRSARFAKLDVQQYKIAQKQIRKRIIGTYPNLNRIAKAGSELGILRHEMGKKRRIMPLRKLFHSIPNLLLTLKPCLMMSPLSVAYFLEANDYHFDMVIFDESSQIFPQDAIGAIFRAKQVIIAGDTKQLPPTNFFSASTSNSSQDFDGGEDYDEEIYDSILEETANVLPNRTLLWHYRSKHEHLIAFSNQEIYKNELVTFPSSNESEPDTGVEFVYVKDGYYEPSPKNYNTLEARRIVELVKEHIEQHPNRSLGVIAFSEKQQQAISMEIQRFREKHSEYEAFFAEGKEDEFFVKNLENVQGDERDTIFFSIGYAKTKEQKANNRPMSMRFGPLGLQGGERRLNVAITRAKINVKLVGSILPSDIDLSKTESEGIRMLRSYIEFAMNGEASLASAHHNSRPDDFADAITRYITQHGFKVRQYVGCSGYKIDIAVQHPSDKFEQYVAGIECDGISYVSARTARDRDRLRSTVLTNMGWNLYRVWSAEWYKNPEIEGQKLIEFIQNAIRTCDEKNRVQEELRRRAEEVKRIELEKARAASEAEERKKQREQELKEAKVRAEREAEERKKRDEAERKKAERKRHEEAERKATKIKAEQEARRREEIRAAEERRRQETEKIDLTWVKLGARVSHVQFGSGVVTALTKDHITVRFGRVDRILIYPDVFEKGLLTKQTVREAPKAKKPDWVKAGAMVTHKSFGDGVIESIDRGYVKVKFGGIVKTFVNPDAFTDGHLTQGAGDVVLENQPKQAQTAFQKRRSFVNYMQDQGYAKGTANGMASAVARVGDYAVENGFSKLVLYEIEDVSALNSIWNKLEKDSNFSKYNLGQNKRFSIAMKHYLTFMKKLVAKGNNANGKNEARKANMGLLESLQKAGFHCIDNRTTSSILWVLYDPARNSDFDRIISQYNVQYRLERRGALATNNTAAWRIMFN